MRLFHTSEYFLQDFVDDHRPLYAILSHTWEDEEILYNDVGLKTYKAKKQWAKVQGACRKAAADGYKWIWIDTLCIDKTSSAELSEAINSMYKWYSEADVCFAYLADFPGGVDVSKPQLESCRWFYRGWTLQELIAPRHLEFYDVAWNELGTRLSLSSFIREITGVCLDVLWGAESVSKYTIACRFSWMAGRATARGEDKAYAMMGLFGINMPLLYGEGSVKAFKRLQEEILRRTDDQSFLLYSCHDDSHRVEFLARSPDEFCRRSTCTSAHHSGITFDYENMRTDNNPFSALDNKASMVSSRQMSRSTSLTTQGHVLTKAGYLSISVWLRYVPLYLPPSVESYLPLQLTDGRESSDKSAVAHLEAEAVERRRGGAQDIYTALTNVYVMDTGPVRHRKWFAIDMCHPEELPGNVFPERIAQVRTVGAIARDQFAASATYLSVLIRIHETDVYTEKPPPRRSTLAIESSLKVQDAHFTFPSWNCAEGVAVFCLGETDTYLAAAFEIQLPSFRPTLRAELMRSEKHTPKARYFFHSYANFQSRTAAAHPTDRVRLSHDGKRVVVSLRRRPGSQLDSNVLQLKLVVTADGIDGPSSTTEVHAR